METKKNSENRKTAFEAACSYLENRMHTTAEVRKHLESKGYGSEETDEAVMDLIGLRYLDDYLYSARYYEYHREKRRGVMRAERELIEKGELRVSVLHSDAKWFGMTYHEDKDAVAAALKALHDAGVYPPTLHG